MSGLVIKKAEDGTEELDLTGVPEDVHPLLQQLWKDRQEIVKEQGDKIGELQKAVDDGKEQLEKGRVALERREAIVKAEQDFGGLPSQAIVLGPILLKTRSVLTEDEQQELERALRAGSEALKAGFVQKGSDQDDGGARTTATEKLERKATEIQKRDKITHEQAWVRALEENPDLARAERDERDRAARAASA